MPKRFFSDTDQERITAAVKSAEGGTSGEVVPYMVSQSDDYDEAELRSTILLGLVPLTAALGVRVFTDLWIAYDTLELAIVTLAFMAIGWLAGRFIPPVKRLLAGAQILDSRVRARATEAFVSEEVFNTRDRTGILLFVSVLEHRVVVVGDSGINARVEKTEWDAVVHAVTRGIKSGKQADGIIEGLRLCGELLKKRGVTRKPDDANELPDALRTGK